MITEQYIRMCQCATELQEAWKPKDGDLLLISKSDLEFDEGIYTYWNNLICNPNFHNWNREWEGLTSPYDSDDEIIIDYDGDELIKQYGIVWLPRQEDLQEICKNSDVKIGVHRLSDWFREKMYFELLGEQGNWDILWMHYTMEKVYYKQWNGTTWETIK